MATYIPLLLVLALAADPVKDDDASAAPAPAADASTEKAKDIPLPEKIPGADAEANAPTVSIRTGDNGDLIEEYRQNGQVTMVRVKPQRGPTYTLMDSNGDGRLDEVDGELNGGVAPVYYTIYEWN